MKNLNSLLLILIITLVFAGCKKDKDAEPTQEQIISGKDWHIASIMVTTGLSPSALEAKGYLPTCQTDNFLRFETNGKVTYDEGSTKCLPNAPQTQQGNYTINGNILTLDAAILSVFGLGGSNSTNLNIDELTEQTLQVTLNEVINVPGFPLPVPITKATITFTPQ